MHYPFNYQNIDGIEYLSEVKILHEEAEKYLQEFTWCKNIIDCSLYLNLGSKLCLFLFKIDNTASRDDNLLWVIVGDIPPMYLDTHGARSTSEVLRCYVELAKDWIDHIRLSKPTDECYPFIAAPEAAGLLAMKVSFIETEVIKNVEDVPLEILN